MYIRHIIRTLARRLFFPYTFVLLFYIFRIEIITYIPLVLVNSLGLGTIFNQILFLSYCDYTQSYYVFIFGKTVEIIFIESNKYN